MLGFLEKEASENLLTIRDTIRLYCGTKTGQLTSIKLGSAVLHQVMMVIASHTRRGGENAKERFLQDT